MKHEALTVNLNRDPLNLAYNDRIVDFQRDHVSFNRTVIERLCQCIVVEVASNQP